MGILPRASVVPQPMPSSHWKRACTCASVARGEAMPMDEGKRSFLKRGIALLGASGLLTSWTKGAVATEPPDVPPWMKSPGAGFNEDGPPTTYEGKVTRTPI